MNEYQAKKIRMQNELALLKKFVPALAEVELKVVNGQWNIFTGLMEYASSFAVDLDENPIIMSGRIVDQLQAFEQFISESLDGLEMYQKMRLAHVGEIEDAKQKGWCDGYDLAFAGGADDFRMRVRELIECGQFTKLNELLRKPIA